MVLGYESTGVVRDDALSSWQEMRYELADALDAKVAGLQIMQKV
jgi:hypothetical protein